MNKKAVNTTGVIAGIIVLVITMVLIINFALDKTEKSNYDHMLLECNRFLSNVDGKPSYFGPNLDEISPSFIKTVQEFCPSKTIKIDKEGIRNAAELLSNCWYSGARGKDFLGHHYRDKGIAIYCGEIIANEDINNFGEELYNILNEEKYKNSLNGSDVESTNFNAYYLYDLEAMKKYTLNEDEGIQVMYFIYRPYFKDNWIKTAKDYYGIETNNVYIDKFFGESENIRTHVGIILKPTPKTIDGTNQEQVHSNVELIVPEKVFS
jgi:hypothetical protein